MWRSSMNLPLTFIKMCRKVGGRSKLDDLSSELTGRGLLIKTLVLRRALLRAVFADDEQLLQYMSGNDSAWV